MHIRIDSVAHAPIDVVWTALADIASHVDWMKDAERITFLTDQRRGVGTTFDCRTTVGPLATTDRMTVTEWTEGCAIGVRHTGIVRGEGRFSLSRRGPDLTALSWDERLAFPVRFGGPLTIWVARPVLRAVWKGNLRRFARRIEAEYRSSR